MPYPRWSNHSSKYGTNELHLVAEPTERESAAQQPRGGRSDGPRL